MYLMEKHFESRMMGILLCALIIMIDHISFVWIILKAIIFILSVLYKFIFGMLVFSEDIHTNRLS